jgi:hypothetical protein
MLTALFLLPAAIFAQPAQRAQPKSTKNPPSKTDVQKLKDGVKYYVSSVIPVVTVDSPGCVDDYLKMRSLAGVAQRKLLADLVETGCIRKLPENVIFIVSPRPDTPGSGAVYYRGFVRVFLFMDVDMMEEFKLPWSVDTFAASFGSKNQNGEYIEIKECHPEEFMRSVANKLNERQYEH